MHLQQMQCTYELWIANFSIQKLFNYFSINNFTDMSKIQRICQKKKIKIYNCIYSICFHFKQTQAIFTTKFMSQFVCASVFYFLVRKNLVKTFRLIIYFSRTLNLVKMKWKGIWIFLQLSVQTASKRNCLLLI